MKPSKFDRRKFIKSATAATSAAGLFSILPKGLLGNSIKANDAESNFVRNNAEPRILFSVIGINHNHIYSQVDSVIRGGGQLVLSSIIPNERAPLGIRVMQHGKDYMSDKPGITSLEQLAEVRRVQKQTGCIYSIMYSERFENKATVKAGELVKAGSIGKVIQTIGL